jgi:hypothetical protein
MFAMIGAFIFCGAAVFSILVMVRMVVGYRSLIIAALNGQPMPRTLPAPARAPRRRQPSPTFTPRRLERERAAA